MNWLPDYKYFLGSKSPRRHQLLSDLGFPFKLIPIDVNENYPEGLIREQIPLYLAELKSDAYRKYLKTCEMLITADTIVWLDGEVLDKPKDKQDAVRILSRLSGNTHQVVTGVCLTTIEKRKTFCTITDVEFAQLEPYEIEYYLSVNQPYDKAGSYGIQDWIGLAGIKSINGSYLNVVGLPVQQLYSEIKNFDS